MVAFFSKYSIAIAAIAATWVIPPAGATDLPDISLTPAVVAGKVVYDAHCAACHGSQGKGDGEARYLLFPKPADFTSGRFKLRSSTPGGPPSDEDLLRTLARGIPGTGMPSFAFLSNEQRRAVVQYVKSLASGVAARLQQAPVPIDPSSPAPPNSPEAVAAGQAVYEKLQCALCHGLNGDGQGEATASLFEPTGMRVRPRDFTRGPFKGGADARDIYLRIATGMDGTPMPAFDDNVVTAQERWQLAYYLKSLCAAPTCAAAEGDEGASLVSTWQPEGTAMDDPLSPVWRTMPPLRVGLYPLWNEGSPPPDLLVRSINDGRTLAFLFEWSDPTQDDGTDKPEQFSDAVAAQFFFGSAFAPLTMGRPGSDVTIWYWNAKWQRDMDRAASATPRNPYPWMIEESYPFPAAAARDLGNARAQMRRPAPAEEVTAGGFGTVTAAPPGDQRLVGKGVWSAGQWHVVLSRKIESPAGAALGNDIKVAFALWNGAQGDRAGQKAISTWHLVQIGNR
jgi:mono/diheme cytochrome c family protein